MSVLVSTTREDALALVGDGKGLEAEELVAEAMRSVPSNTAAYAALLFDLATVRIRCGDPTRAVEPLMKAVALRFPDAEAEKARLTYAMNLGELLQRVGQLDESERVLRTSLAERADFYGKDHAGYAYGLEPLAQLLFARGSREARDLIDAAAAIFWKLGNPRVGAAIATRAPMMKTTSEPAFVDAARLPDEPFDDVVSAALGRESITEPALQLRVLEELREVVRARRGETAWQLPHIMAATTRVATRLGAHDARREATRWLVSHFEAQGNAAREVEARLALANCEDDAGDIAAAARSFEAAVVCADASGDAAARSLAHRNYGLFLAHKTSEVAGARAALATAVRVANEGGAREMAARAQIALGLHYQHAGDLTTARAYLEPGTAALAAGDPDALCGSSHLHAIRTGAGCGCGDMGIAISDALAQMVAPHLPAGLLASLRMRDNGEIDIHLARAPSPEEAALLERVVHHAAATLRKKVTAPR